MKKYNIVWETYSPVNDGKRNILSKDILCTCSTMGTAMMIHKALSETNDNIYGKNLINNDGSNANSIMNKLVIVAV